MTAHRRPEIPFTDAPRGACRWCGESILHAEGDARGQVNRRRRWHPECVDEYNLSDPREARRKVRKRDRGVCRECRTDTNALRREVKGRGRTGKLRALGFKPRRSLWELDHIVPLIDGGGHGLDNMQTLCVPCHGRKSAREATERATRRRDTQAADAPDSTPPLVAPKTGRTSAARPRDRVRLESLLERADEVNRRAKSLLHRLGH